MGVREKKKILFSFSKSTNSFFQENKEELSLKSRQSKPQGNKFLAHVRKSVHACWMNKLAPSGGPGQRLCRKICCPCLVIANNLGQSFRSRDLISRLSVPRGTPHIEHVSESCTMSQKLFLWGRGRGGLGGSVGYASDS